MTNAQARRALLGAQGFTDGRPIGKVDSRHFRRVVSRVGLLQIDSVNVVARAHYLPMFARLGPYSRERLDRFIYDTPEMFEYWSHEQAYTPIHLHPAMRTRMAANADRRWRRIHDVECEHPGYVDGILAEVAERGPISSRQLDDPGERTGPWWGYGKGKITLEWLFAVGKICVSRRVNFERFYDLPERVIPSEVLDLPDLDIDQSNIARVRVAVRSLAVGTVKDIADYFRMKVKDTGQALDALVAEGSVVPVEIAEWGRPAFADAQLTLPRAINAQALLAPFDPVVWDRQRSERVFDFHYRIEIYTPEPKRRFGYYVLPFMIDGELVARVDVKADRQGRVLRAKGAFAEDGVDRIHVADRLATELESMAGWLGLDDVVVGNKGDLAAPLEAALR